MPGLCGNLPSTKHKIQNLRSHRKPKPGRAKVLKRARSPEEGELAFALPLPEELLLRKGAVHITPGGMVLRFFQWAEMGLKSGGGLVGASLITTFTSGATRISLKICCRQLRFVHLESSQNATNENHHLGCESDTRQQRMPVEGNLGQPAA